MTVGSVLTLKTSRKFASKRASVQASILHCASAHSPEFATIGEAFKSSWFDAVDNITLCFCVVDNITPFCWTFHPIFSSERIWKIG